MKFLELNNVVKHFGGLKAIDELSFDIEQGESVALIGPNGAGKTTIFSLIMGQLKMNSGSIEFQGEDISKIPTFARVGLGLSRTYQVTKPFMGMTVLENIRVGMMSNSIWKMISEPPDIESEKALARSVGFNDKDFNINPGKLSMGDLRKLELARTLAAAPKLILLDEIFAGLTVGEIQQIAELISKKRKEGITFVIVSHDLPSLEPLVDRAIAMSFGKKVTEGSFDAVMNNTAFREAYIGSENN